MQRQRGRPRKPRLLRIDAAVDAMSQMGFAKQRVMKCVKQLLEVYGGNDGWPFIEADSYKELFEALLRLDKENEQDRVREVGEQSNSKLIPESENMPEENEEPLETSERAPETQTEDATQQNPDKSEDNAPENAVRSSGAIAESGCSKYSSTSLSMVYNADRTATAGCKGIVQCQSHVSASEPSDHVLNKNGEEPKARAETDNNAGHKSVTDPKKIETDKQVRTSMIPRSVTVSFPLATIKKQPIKRKSLPCFGWIEDEDDEEDCPNSAVHKTPDDSKKIEAKSSKSNYISSPSPIVGKKPVKANRFPCYGWIDDDKEASPSNDVHKIVPDPKKIEAHRQGKSSKIPQSNNTSSPLPNLNKWQPIKRRRFPCYGWIDNEEDDAQIEFVYSKPAPGSFSAKPVYKGKETLLRSPSGERKRKPSRWDQSPTY